MSNQIRFEVELELPKGTDTKDWLKTLKLPGRVLSSKVLATSPKPGVQVAFIYNSGIHHDPCHAVVKDKDGPWSRNRYGFCGVEPDSGPVGSIDQPDGGLCHVCEKYIEKKKDGKWYVRDGAPLPKPKNDYVEPSCCYDDD